MKKIFKATQEMFKILPPQSIVYNEIWGGIALVILLGILIKLRLI